MNGLRQVIQSELDNLDLKYDSDKDGNVIVFSINMDNSTGSIKVVIQLMEQRYLVYALLNNRVKKAKLPAMSEFLHRVNSGLINGNFELDYATGEIRYKSYMNAMGINISGDVIRESIMIPIMMFSKYGDALLKVMTSKETPESVFNSIK